MLEWADCVMLGRLEEHDARAHKMQGNSNTLKTCPWRDGTVEHLK